MISVCKNLKFRFIIDKINQANKLIIIVKNEIEKSWTPIMRPEDVGCTPLFAAACYDRVTARSFPVAN